MIYHINKRKDKNHMIVSIDAKKPADKIQNLFMVTTLIKVCTERTYLNIIKIIYDKIIVNMILNARKQKVFLLTSGTRKGCPLSLLFNTLLTRDVLIHLLLPECY